MDCLVTRLKATVADNSLTRLNMLKLTKQLETSPTGLTQYISIASTSEAKLEALNGAEFYASSALTDKIGNEVSILGEGTGWITNGGAMLIKNVYDITELIVGGKLVLNCAELSQCHSLNRLEISGDANTIGDTKEFAFGLPSEMRTLKMTYFEAITGDIKDFANIAIETLNLYYLKSLGGDISDLNVKRIQTINLAETGVSGSIESLVANLISVGRTTGTISMPTVRYTKLTYKGSPLSNQFDIPTNQSTTKMSWTADGTITWSA